MLCVLLLSSAGCSSSKTVTRTEFMLDTFVTVTLYGSGDEAALDGAMELCRYYDSMLDRHRPDSLISLLNRGQESVALEPEVYEMLQTALEVGAISRGLYDVTIAPVMDLWDFKSNGAAVPEQEELEQALARVDQRNLLLGADGTARMTNGAQLDLGSIAKGFVADQIAQYLRERKVPGAVVNLGGNVITVGKKPGNKPFVIGVQKPFGNRQELAGTLEIDNASLVSAGLYERSFTGADGVIYHHIIDATTGMPAHTGLLSVTVLSPSSTQADALSTLCFLLGPDEGMQLLEGRAETEGIFLTTNGQTLLSSGLTDRYQPSAKP